MCVYLNEIRMSLNVVKREGFQQRGPIKGHVHRRISVGVIIIVVGIVVAVVLLKYGASSQNFILNREK